MKKILLLTALVALIASSAFAQVPAKPFTIYVGGGLTLPMSPDVFKDGWSTGFHGSAQLGFNSIPKGEFLLNLEFHRFGADFGDLSGYDGGAFSSILVGGDFKLNFGLPMAPTKPFILGGVGLAVLSFSDLTTPSGTATFDSENDFPCFRELNGIA